MHEWAAAPSTVYLSGVKNVRDYTHGRIRATFRETPTTIDRSAAAIAKADQAEVVLMRRTNILAGVPDEVLIPYSDKSAIALAELARRSHVEELEAEAGAGLSDLAPVGYEDLDVFELLDEDGNGRLDRQELESLVVLLELNSTTEEVFNDIKSWRRPSEDPNADISVTEFAKWYNNFAANRNKPPPTSMPEKVDYRSWSPIKLRVHLIEKLMEVLEKSGFPKGVIPTDPSEMVALAARLDSAAHRW